MNYITILTDGMRADFANNQEYTPCLHEFFEKYGGYKFVNAYATSNWTFASMMSFHTALLPSKNGLWDITYGKHAGRLEKRDAAFKAVSCEDDDFLLTKLRKAGYTTRYIGDQRIWSFFNKSINHLYDISSFYDFQYMQLKTWQQQKFEESFFVFSYDVDGGHDPWGTFVRDDKDAVEGMNFRGDCQTAFAGRYVKNHQKDFPMSRLHQLFGDQVKQYDKKLKLFFEWFVESDLYKNTTLFFFADHGESLWEHPGIIGHAMSLYEEEVRIPLFVYRPPLSEIDFKGGLREIYDPVSIVDIMPTVLCAERAGDGVNLFVRRRTRFVFFEFTRYAKEKGIADEWKILPSPVDFIRGVRFGKYKLLYIRDLYGKVNTELYDLSKNFSESKMARIENLEIEKFLMDELIRVFNMDVKNLSHIGRLEEVVRMEEGSR